MARAQAGVVRFSVVAHEIIKILKKNQKRKAPSPEELPAEREGLLPRIVASAAVLEERPLGRLHVLAQQLRSPKVWAGQDGEGTPTLRTAATVAAAQETEIQCLD